MTEIKTESTTNSTENATIPNKEQNEQFTTDQILATCQILENRALAYLGWLMAFIAAYGITVTALVREYFSDDCKTNALSIYFGLGLLSAVASILLIAWCYTTDKRAQFIHNNLPATLRNVLQMPPTVVNSFKCCAVFCINISNYFFTISFLALPAMIYFKVYQGKIKTTFAFFALLFVMLLSSVVYFRFGAYKLMKRAKIWLNMPSRRDKTDVEKK